MMILSQAQQWPLRCAGAEPDVHLPTDEVWQYRQFNPGWGPAGVGDDGWSKGKVKKHIAKNGIQDPITVSTNGTHGLVEDGHHRLAIAKELGMSHVPVNIQHVDMPTYSPFGQTFNMVGKGLRNHLQSGGSDG